jgi:hypothetical protein
MGWKIVPLVISILAAILGIWNLARQRNVFLSLAGIFWFIVILFWVALPGIYEYHLFRGVPDVGTLLLYIVVPIFLVLSFFGGGRR